MDYIVKRSSRKTVSLEITKDLKVLIRAPYNMPESEIWRFASKHGQWIETHLEKLRQNRRPEPTLGEIQKLKTTAEAIIYDRVDYFSKKMSLYPQGVKITSAKTRFGSCSGKNRLCFSCFLMLYPPEAVDYVVVHELAHIKHKNHKKDFWALVATVFPDYKERRAILRKIPANYTPWS